MTNSEVTPSSSRNFFAGVDLWAILLYVVIVLIGCMCITSATFDETSTDYFSFSHFYIKQLLWVSVAFLSAIFVLLVDSNIFHKYSYMLYLFGVLLLILTLIFGREVNGAKSWFEFGAFRIQPVELVKISTAMVMARVMSEHTFSIARVDSLAKVALVIAIPLGIIILQNDTGSGIVFCSFLLVLYREGLNTWLITPLLLVVTLFILSFLLTPLALLLLSIGICLLYDALISGDVKLHIIYFATLFLGSTILTLYTQLFMVEPLSTYAVILIVSAIMLPFAITWAVRLARMQTLIIIGMFTFANLFVPLCSYIFNSILRSHQQNRIMSFLGIVSDPLGIDYNVNQSKIAIGSGGFWGKGFLNGTQIKYGFVPEKHTDFIFCDLAEEWGFIGVLFLLGALFALIWRLIMMGERQVESFGRVYCYCVASILLFHIFVNVGMTVGLMPVMGIPLPFMSYGGSSLVAFTIMLFIAFRLDSAVRR
ncbi:MAG: rod shape-determining protein RodA [Rikenellaceae bacterium]